MRKGATIDANITFIELHSVWKWRRIFRKSLALENKIVECMWRHQRHLGKWPGICNIAAFSVSSSLNVPSTSLLFESSRILLSCKQWILRSIELMIGAFFPRRNMNPTTENDSTEKSSAKIFLSLEWPIYGKYILSNANQVLVGFRCPFCVFRLIKQEKKYIKRGNGVGEGRGGGLFFPSPNFRSQFR